MEKYDIRHSRHLYRLSK